MAEEDLKFFVGVLIRSFLKVKREVFNNVSWETDTSHSLIGTFLARLVQSGFGTISKSHMRGITSVGNGLQDWMSALS